MNEIVRWNVSMTLTISASALLKFFASLVFMVFVDTVGDMLIDLAQPDLELVTVVQHCRNLVAFLVSKLILLCWSPSRGVRLPPASESISLFESLFQRHAPDFRSYRFLYKL